MEGERDKSRDRDEGGGQQQPLGQQGQNQSPSGEQQPTGKGGQQPLDQQGNFGTQEPGLGRQTDQGFGQAGDQPGQNQGSDAATLSQNERDIGPGGYSPESGASDLGGGETGLGDRSYSNSGGGFVGSQGQESGEYLQQSGSPESGFAEQGRGASNKDAQRSDSEDSDIDGSSDSI